MEAEPSSSQNPQNQKPQDLNEAYGHVRIALLILGVFVLTIIGKTCGKKEVVDNVKGQAVVIQHPPTTVAVSPKPSDSSLNKEGSTKTDDQFVPPEGSITITPKDPTKSLDDLVRIHYQEIGWTFEPGIECSGNLYFSCGLDAKLFYVYRFGVGTGIVRGSNIAPLPIMVDIFVSYRLDKLHLRNTEFIVTYVAASKIPLGVGLRINL